MPSILDRLSETIESLTELRVTTGVGPVKLDVTPGGARGPNVTPAQSTASVSGIYSEINLLTGDIVTLIDADFNEPNNPTLEFHKTQVENGGQIVSKNIETIIALLKAVGGQLDLNRAARETQA